MTKSFKQCVASLGLLATTTVSVQAQETQATVDAYAAGYKAAFTCSAVFNAGKQKPAIDEHEFTGIYSLVQERVIELTADVDLEQKRVLVDYSDTMPPRISQWRPYLGCVQLPVGTTSYEISDLPQADGLPSRNTGTDNGAPWTKRNGVNEATGNAALDDVIRRAFIRGEYGANARTTAILIATPDEIIAENYIDGFTPTTSQRTWSVAKSIAASVV